MLPGAMGVRWILVVAFLSCSGVLFVVAVESIFLPFGLDQGWFARVSDVLLEGGLPYRDAWEVKSPATHYSYAISELLFGRGTYAVRVLDLVFLTAALVALWKLGRANDLLGRALACLFFATLYLRLGYWDGAQPDPWASIWILIGIAVLDVPRQATGPWDARGRALVAGCCVGLAGLYKLPYLVLGLPVAVAGWQLHSKLRGVRSVAYIALGTATVLVACVGWFVWQGGLRELLEIQLGFNMRVHSAQLELHAAAHILYFATVFTNPGFAVLLPFIALGAVRLRRVDPRTFWIWGSWLGTAAGLLVLQGRYYPYQCSILFAPLSYFAGLGAATGARCLRTAMRKNGWPGWTAETVIALVIVTTFSIAAPPITTSGWKTHVGGTIQPMDYLQSFDQRGIWSPQHTYALAAAIRARSNARDSVFVWGLAPGVHYLARRKPPARFASSYPLIAGESAGYRDRYRSEFLETIRAAPPQIIVIGTQDGNSLYDGNTWEHYLEFDAFRDFVSEHYQLVGHVSHFRIFERRIHGAGEVSTVVPERIDAKRKDARAEGVR